MGEVMNHNRKINFLFFLNNRGEVPSAPPAPPTPPAEVKFSAEQQQIVDRIVQDRVARERSKYADYDELAKFKREHEVNAEAQKQKELEAQKNYEQAKLGLEKQITDLQGVVKSKDTLIADLNISHSLTAEIMAQGGYVDEALAMLKGNAVVQEGNVLIKGKDANGIEVMLPIADGVKQFLTARPYLVKATQKSGPSGPGGLPPAPAAGTDTLTDLNEQYQKAIFANDFKKAAEIKQKMKGNLSAAGISRLY